MWYMRATKVLTMEAGIKTQRVTNADLDRPADLQTCGLADVQTWRFEG